MGEVGALNTSLIGIQKYLFVNFSGRGGGGGEVTLYNVFPYNTKKMQFVCYKILGL